MATDTELQREVLGELKANRDIGSQQIAVAVDGGVVTLTGNVSSFNQKWTAESLAKHVPGVYAVVNELQVQLPAFSERTDADIAGEALTVLSLSPSVPADRIKVLVDNGWLTLEGTVDRQSQKEAAEEILRNVTGLKGISNLLQVRLRTVAEEVKSKIDEALWHDGRLDAQNISVAAIDGRIILEGKVHDRQELEEAEQAARSVPGVQRVENHIRVVH